MVFSFQSIVYVTGAPVLRGSFEGSPYLFLADRLLLSLKVFDVLRGRLLCWDVLFGDLLVEEA